MKLILIGFMGSGKTTIGNILSKKLNMDIVDMDLEIEKKLNISINDIFNLYGEKYFRNKEVELLEKLLKKDNIIISTGGGIIETKEVINMLKEEKLVIWLNADIKTTVNRLKSELDNRPKLKYEKNLENTIKNLINNRYYKYKKASNIIIDVNNKNIDEVVSEILVYIDKNMLL